jgi:hypothetical protein
VEEDMIQRKIIPLDPIIGQCMAFVFGQPLCERVPCGIVSPTEPNMPFDGLCFRAGICVK